MNHLDRFPEMDYILQKLTEFMLNEDKLNNKLQNGRYYEIIFNFKRLNDNSIYFNNIKFIEKNIKEN